MSQEPFKLSVFTGLLGMALAVTPVAMGAPEADDPASTARKPTVERAAQQSPAMMAVKDPVTGKLRAPTAEEAAELRKSAAKPDIRGGAAKSAVRRTPQTVKGPEGAIGMVLDDDSTIYAVATRKPDGKVAVKETTGSKAAPTAKTGGSDVK
jgi:hypothetical protein